MIEAFEIYAPDLMDLVSNAINLGHIDLGFFRLGVEPWTKCNNISVDYAIMEKLDTLYAVPYSGLWNDLGGWDAVWVEQKPDEKGVVSGLNTTALSVKMFC